MDNLSMWSLVVGAVAPLLIAVVQRPTMTDRARALIMLVFCVVAGAVTAYLNGAFGEVRPMATSVLLVLVTAVSTYKGFWKPTGSAPAIESATTPTP